MQFKLNTVSLNGSKALHRFADRNVRRTLGRLAHRVREIQINVAPVRQRVRKREMEAKMVVKLAAGGEQIVLREQRSNAYDAVERILIKAREALKRRTEKRNPRRYRETPRRHDASTTFRQHLLN